MKTLICPDKFKGSLTAIEVARAVKEGLPNHFRTTLIPMADGGEGSLEVVADNLEGKWIYVTVNDPLFRPISAKYFLSEETAYVEMAKASGYELLTDEERDCTKTTTFGTGELIRNAINQGAKSIYLFVGGSATNDGGMGVAVALGYKFLDKSENELSPIGENLIHIHEICLPERSLANVKFTVVCDVTNPFYGSNGAAHVYAAQKGANEKQILELDEGLENLTKIIKQQFGIDLQKLPGAGAAGGLGGGAIAFLNATVKSGTKTLIEITKLEEKIKSSDLIITGEGKVDKQSVSGKLIDGICGIARTNNVPVWIICGISEISQTDLASLGVAKVVELVNEETPSDYAIQHAKILIERRIRTYFKE
ncbi:MAG: glycerate kinase [Spirosomataceae bacterium]|jgi:glycerate kinase